jgi:hypothetical protein
VSFCHPSTGPASAPNARTCALTLACPTSYGIFRLTQPPGLPHIMQCTQSATFHQHSIDNIYTNAVHAPGHVYETDRLDFAVEDLRPGFGKK